jgi:hypothetical protein
LSQSNAGECDKLLLRLLICASINLCCAEALKA